MAALIAIAGAVRRRIGVQEEPRLAPVAVASLGLAGAAWLLGFGLFVAALSESLTSTQPEEIMFRYPPAALVAACWSFAAAAALTLVASPGLALAVRPHRWSVWRRMSFALIVTTFLACAATLWGLGFLGYSGW